MTSNPARTAVGVAALGAAILVGQAAGAGARPQVALRPTIAYATNGGSVTPIDTATNKAGTPIPAGANTDGLAITPDGSKIYAANYFAGTVTPIDTATQTAGTDIDFSGGGPVGVAVTPDGSTAYVVDEKHAALVPIDTATNAIGTPIPTGGDSPRGVAITPDGKTAYVTNYLDGSVTPIDLVTGTAGTKIGVGFAPAGIAMAPNGRRVYVVTDNTVAVIDTATNTTKPPIDDGGTNSPGPAAIAITPDGLTAYVARWDGNVIVPINLKTRAVGTPFPTRHAPFALAITPDGKTAYVAFENNPGKVSPIDLDTGVTGKLIKIGGFANGIAISPDQPPIAHFTATPAAAGGFSEFDASTSVRVSSPIATYHWSFGDHERAVSVNPTITHVYQTAGRYTVVLVVTDATGTSTTQAFTGQTMTHNGGPNARFARRITIAGE